MTEPLTLPALAAELSIYTASETRTAWMAWLDSAALGDADARVEVDASAVDTVDGAGIQLLLSLSRALAERGATLSLVAPSTPLVDACRTLGVASLVDDAETVR